MPSARPSTATTDEPEDGWAGAVVCAEPDARTRPSPCAGTLRAPGRAAAAAPARRGAEHQLADLQLREDHLRRLLRAARFTPTRSRPGSPHLFWRTGRGPDDRLIEHGPLVLNLETYQAAVAGRALDLTYMEYELLRFLAARPGKVFTRETLLSRVWGYEYYGGARTVDVHIRRLRAKLGEEHAHLIQTVRSVGYRFGQGTWDLVKRAG